MAERQATLNAVLLTRVAIALPLLLLLQSAACGLGTKHDPRNFWTPDYEARIEEFSVLDKDGTTIWRIDGPGSSPVTRIEYGGLPDGFRQEIPKDPQRPRPLVAGEALTIKAKTDEAIFQHEGTAISEDSFRGGPYQWTPLRR